MGLPKATKTGLSTSKQVPPIDRNFIKLTLFLMQKHDIVQALYCFLDMEVKMEEGKIGKEIYDLALVFSENHEEFLEFLSCFLSKRKDGKRVLMTFSEYCSHLVDSLNILKLENPGRRIIIVAHNGIMHDFPIIFNNLETRSMLDVFKDCYFLDSIKFFKRFNKDHVNPTIESFSQEKLFFSYLQKNYFAHAASTDARALCELFNSSYNNVSFIEYLSSQPDLIVDFQGIYFQYDRIKVRESKRVGNYRSYQKQLETAFEGYLIEGSSIHDLLDNDVNFYDLLELGKHESYDHITNTINSIIKKKDDVKRIIKWCLDNADMRKNDYEIMFKGIIGKKLIQIVMRENLHVNRMKHIYNEIGYENFYSKLHEIGIGQDSKIKKIINLITDGKKTDSKKSIDNENLEIPVPIILEQVPEIASLDKPVDEIPQKTPPNSPNSNIELTDSSPEIASLDKPVDKTPQKSPSNSPNSNIKLTDSPPTSKKAPFGSTYMQQLNSCGLEINEFIQMAKENPASFESKWFEVFPTNFFKMSKTKLREFKQFISNEMN